MEILPRHTRKLNTNEGKDNRLAGKKGVSRRAMKSSSRAFISESDTIKSEESDFKSRFQRRQQDSNNNWSIQPEWETLNHQFKRNICSVEVSESPPGMWASLRTKSKNTDVLILAQAPCATLPVAVSPGLSATPIDTHKLRDANRGHWDRKRVWVRSDAKDWLTVSPNQMLASGAG